MDGYKFQRRFYQDVSGSKIVGTADAGPFTLAAGRAGHTIYLQSAVAYVTTDAAQSLTLQDSNGTPLVVAEVTASPGDQTRWDFDFGSEGQPLTEGKDLTVALSGAGLGVNLVFLAYIKPTSTLVANVAGVKGSL
jgi:hypothetical protein